MTLEMMYMILASVYIFYVILAMYNGVVKMKDKKSWYLVNESVLKVLIATAIAFAMMFMFQTYKVDSLKKEVQYYERKVKN